MGFIPSVPSIYGLTGKKGADGTSFSLSSRKMPSHISKLLKDTQNFTGNISMYSSLDYVTSMFIGSLYISLLLLYSKPRV